MLLRRRKTKHPLQVGEKLGARLFRDADGTVALYVGVSAQRADPGSRLADIPAHQQQVGYQAYIRGALIVLGDAHAVGDNRGVRFSVRRRHPFKIAARQARLAFDIRPRGRVDISRKVGKAQGMLIDKGPIQHLALLCFQPEQRLRDTLKRRRVAARFNLEIGRRDVG